MDMIDDPLENFSAPLDKMLLLSDFLQRKKTNPKKYSNMFFLNFVFIKMFNSLPHWIQNITFLC